MFLFEHRGLGLFGNPEPVCIYPSTVSLGVFALTDESHLGTNPLALAHGEEVACFLEVLAIHTVSELAFAIFDLHLEIDVKIDGR